MRESLRDSEECVDGFISQHLQDPEETMGSRINSLLKDLEAQARMREMTTTVEKYCKGQITKSQALDIIYFSHREKPPRK